MRGSKICAVGFAEVCVLILLLAKPTHSWAGSKNLRDFDYVEREAARHGIVTVGAARLSDYEATALDTSRRGLIGALRKIRQELQAAKLGPQRIELQSIQRALELVVSVSRGQSSGTPGEAADSASEPNEQGSEGSKKPSASKLPDLSAKLQDLQGQLNKMLEGGLEADRIASTRLRLAALRFIESELQDLDLNSTFPPAPGFRRMELSLDLIASLSKGKAAGVVVYVDLYPQGADAWAHWVGKDIRSQIGQVCPDCEEGDGWRRWGKTEATQLEERFVLSWPKLRAELKSVEIPDRASLDFPQDYPSDPVALAHRFLANNGLLPRLVHVDPLDEGEYVREGRYELLGTRVGLDLGKEKLGKERGLAAEYKRLKENYEQSAKIVPYDVAFAAGQQRAGWIFLPAGARERPGHRRIRIVVDLPHNLKALSVQVHKVFVDEHLTPISRASFGRQLEHLNDARRTLSWFEEKLKEIPPIHQDVGGPDFVPASQTIWLLGKSRMRNLLFQGWSEEIVLPVPRPGPAPAVGAPLPSALRADPYCLFGDVLVRGGDGKLTISKSQYVVVGSGLIRYAGPERPSGMPVVDTQGLILPGLINLHDHLRYDYLPRFSETLFSKRSSFFKNRYEWQRDSAYREFSEAHAKRTNGAAALAFEAYGEMRQLVGGTTAVADSVEPAPGWGDLLARNLYGDLAWDAATRFDYEVFFLDPHEARLVPPRAVVNTVALNHINTADTSIVHLCEGRKKDDFTKEEFDAFVDWARKHPVEARKIILVHLVGLTADQFRTLASLGINRAVWSPCSNLTLYGETMDVAAALQAGFTVSLGTDWYPTGTDSLFDEFRLVHRLWKEKREGVGTLSEEQLLSMLLKNPSGMIGNRWPLGEIAAGYLADLVVIPNVQEDLAKSILEADVDNIKLVAVAGQPYYGQIALLDELVEGVYPSPVVGRPWGFSFNYAEIVGLVRQSMLAEGRSGAHPVEIEIEGHRGDEPKECCLPATGCVLGARP